MRDDGDAVASVTDEGNDSAPTVPKTTVMMTTSNDGGGDY